MNPNRKIIQDVPVPRNTGRSFVLKKGQVIRVIGTSIVDLVAFNLHDLTDRFDQARTKVYNRTIFVTTGHKLLTRANHFLLTIKEDTYKEGTHDLQHGMCSRARFELAAKEGRLAQYYFREIPPDEIPDHGCWENLQDAFKGYDIAPEDIPSPFNIVQSMEVVGREGKLVWQQVRDRPEPGKPAYVELRAEIDCLVGLSACPDWKYGQPVDVKVFEK